MSTTPPTDVVNVKHLRGLPPVPTVATPGFRKTQVVAADAAELREIAVVAGEPGLGKSFAVYHYVVNQSLPWLWLDMPPKPSPKEIVVRLLRELTGTCDQRLPVYELSDELCTVLASEPRLIVIDEAQHLDSQGLHQLRYLHDRADADWGLIFAGGAGCEKVLSSDPQLNDRIGGRVRFDPLDGPELLQTLDAFSPFYAAADRQLLMRVDQVYAHGVFRRWARLLQVGSRLAEAAGTDRLDTTVARASLAKLAVEKR